MKNFAKNSVALVVAAFCTFLPALAGADPATFDQLKTRYEQNTREPEPAREFAVALARAGRTSEALALLTRVVAEHPVNDAAFFDLLVIHTWAGQHREAVLLYESGKRNNLPSYVLAAVGGAYYRTGEFAKARDIYRRLVAQGDDRARIWEAESMMQLGDTSGADQIYESVLKADPDNYQAYLSRAVMRIESNDPVSAQSDIAAALRLTSGRPAEARVRSEAAAFFIRNGENTRGIALLKQLIEAGQADVYMQSDYVLALRRNGNYLDAINQANRFWKDLSAIPPYGLQALADSYLRTGKSEDANRVYRLILEKQPDFNSVKLGLAYTNMLNKNIDEGLALYRSLLSAQPTLAATAQDDAAALNRLGHYHAAKQLYSLVSSIFPENLLFKREFANDLSAYGFPRAAYEQYRQISLMPGGSLPGQTGLATTALRIGDYGTAEAHVQTLKSQYGSSLYAMPALKLYEVRRLGGAELRVASQSNHQKEETFSVQSSADWNVGGSYSLLAATNLDRLKEVVGDANQTVDLWRHSLGARHVGLYHDYQLWYDYYNAADNASGYRLQTRHFLDDDRLILGLGVSRTPVADVQTLGTAAARVMSNQYQLSLSGSVGLLDSYSLAWTTANYSDANRFNNYSLYWNHVMVNRGDVNYNWFLFGSHGKFKLQVPEYDSPETRLGYGGGLYGHWEIPSGYWAATTTIEWSADRPDPIDFTPYFRLEYGHRFSPTHELIAGAAYGLRTDRINNDSGLHFSFRQYDVTYRMNW